MLEPTIPTRTYVIVCGLLILLTLLTLSISLLPLPGMWHLIIGLAIACCKGSLVVLFFMHAMINPRLTWIAIAVACFWVGILFLLTLDDYFTRGLIPFTPGH